MSDLRTTERAQIKYSRLSIIRTSTGPKTFFELRNVRIKGSSYKNALKGL